jgi:DNA-binding NarL/FixJ family response regulator
MINIILIDDHKVVRQGVKSLLDSEPGFKVVGDTDDGREALILIRDLKPDILITDLKMDKMNGLEVTLLVRELSPRTKIIVLSMYGAGFVSEALKNGASGYVLKGGGIDEVIKAVREVSTGGIYVTPGLDKDN